MVSHAYICSIPDCHLSHSSKCSSYWRDHPFGGKSV